MANRILTEWGWEGRTRLKLGVDEAYLSDAEIQQPEVIGVAESNIIDIVPGWESLPEDKLVWLKAAIVCECARILCPVMAVRVPVVEEGPHFTRNVRQDWDKRRAELQGERDYYIGKVEPITSPRHFTRSKRG